jgi:serine/threonine-protein kinase PRP4
MLLLMMEVKGRFNGKMIKKAKFGDVYFDEMGGFESVEKDRITGNVSHRIAFPFLFSCFRQQDVIRKVHISKPTRDLRARLMPPSSVKLNDEETKLLTSFIELLDKCLTLDPSRRITPREALAHPFIRG